MRLFLFFLFGTIISSIQANYYVWTSSSSGSQVGRVWQSIASDETGQNWIAVTDSDTPQNSNIYTSSDYGSSWTSQSLLPYVWNAACSDSSGQHLVVVNQNGLIYTSSDYGKQWNQQPSPGAIVDWNSVTSDATGQHVAIVGSNSVYTSSDYGNSWRLSLSHIGLSTVTSDSTGQYLAAAVGVELGGIYTTSNQGRNWTQTSAPIKTWQAIASDASGQYLAAAVNNGGIYTSSNYGGNWTLTSAPRNSAWTSITSDGSGGILAATIGGAGGNVYFSMDYGITWNEATVPQHPWQTIACNSIGSILIAAAVDGTIYIGTFVPTSQPTIQPSSHPSSQPFSSPTSQPTVTPTDQPSCSPTSQPSSQPTHSPSIQPTSHPTGQPSATPTSNPTISTDSIVYASAKSSINSNGYLVSNTIINDLGRSQPLFLTVKFLQTGFSSNSFTVSITVNGQSLICKDCSVNGVCGQGYVICCENQEVTNMLSNADGGQLTIAAKSSVPYQQPLCSGSATPYFHVNYTVTKGFGFPTAQPTPSPSPSPVAGASELANVFIPGAAIVFISLFAVVGTAIHYGRKEDANVYPLSLTKAIVTLVMFGGSFLSQIFSMLVFFSGQYNPGFGSAWVLFRVLFIVGGAALIAWLLSESSGYQKHIDWKFMAKNRKLYGFIVVLTAFNPNLVSMLPWLQTPVTAMTMGFPTVKLFYLTTFLAIVESLILTIINTAFAIDQKNVFFGFGDATV
jgi:hypothetical protein